MVRGRGWLGSGGMNSQTIAVSWKVWVWWWVWTVAPCTLAIVTGPLISVLYSLTQSAYVRDGSFSVAQPIRGMLCLLMFCSLFLSGNLRLLGLPVIRPQLVLAVYAGLTCALGPYPYEHITFAARLVFMALVFASAFHLAQTGLHGDRWLIVNAWAILAFMTASQLIGFFTGKTVAAYESSYATAGIIERASIAATLIVSTLPVFLGYFPDFRWALAGVLIALGSLFLAMQRTPLIAAAAVLFVVFARYLHPIRRRIYRSRAVMAILILCASAAVGLRTPAGSDFLKRMGDLDPRGGSGSGRYIFWRISLDHLLSRDVASQFVGEGVGSVRDVIFKQYGMAIKSHTDWLDFPFAFGVFGLMALVWWYAELIRLLRYLSAFRHPAFQGALSVVIVFFLLSLGQGGESYDPSLALAYAALGFWAGYSSPEGPMGSVDYTVSM